MFFKYLLNILQLYFEYRKKKGANMDFYIFLTGSILVLWPVIKKIFEFVIDLFR